MGISTPQRRQYKERRRAEQRRSTIIWSAVAVVVLGLVLGQLLRGLDLPDLKARPRQNQSLGLTQQLWRLLALTLEKTLEKTLWLHPFLSANAKYRK